MTVCNIAHVVFDDSYGLYQFKIGGRGGIELVTATGDVIRIGPKHPQYSKLKALFDHMRKELGEFMDTQSFCKHK